MPSSILVVFGILVVGSFAYLVFDTIKENDTERLIKKIDKLSEQQEKIIKLLKDRENKGG